MELLQKTLSRIEPVEEALLAKAQAKLDQKTKPLGSLGRLEEVARRVAAITRDLSPKIDKKVIYTFAGDHGVVAEGVSAFPKEVTPQMVLNFLAGGAGVNVLARHAGAEVRVVDIGVDYDFEPAPGLTIAKVAHGTRNLAKESAMTTAEAVAAIEVGIALAEEAKAEGVTILGTGEMGIGNTTPSSAIIAALSGCSVAEVTSRGTGINDSALQRKVEVIEAALALHRPNAEDPLEVLTKLGGLEIAGIAGLVLGAAANRIPVVVDGFISTAGALIATEMHPAVKDYVFAAHASVEIGHALMLQRIGAEPLLDLKLRLGEGTGAALAMSLLEAGVRVLNEMATFAEAGVSEG